MTLFTVKEEHPENVRAAVNEILPVWLDAFNHILQVDVASELTGANAENWEGIAVRIAVFQALEIILNSFPSTLKSLLPQYLSFSIAHLNALLPIYNAAYLSNSSDLSIPSAVGEEDSDISTDLSTLVSTVLDFVAQASRRKVVRGLFVEGKKPTAALVEFLVKTIELAQMTTEDVRYPPALSLDALLIIYADVGGELGYRPQCFRRGRGRRDGFLQRPRCSSRCFYRTSLAPGLTLSKS
jgi:hypothetical protein